MVVRNAFSAFRIEPDTGTIDTLRTDLAFALRQFIENCQNGGLGQAKIGEILGLKQSVVSQIKGGNINHLSVERLIRAMVRAKMPGYAEWGATAEHARAGVGVHVAQLVSTSIAVVPEIGSPYGTNWLSSDVRLSDKPVVRVKASE
ncbi:MAG: XRE family transcriptional regulator [Acidobacteriaceae bacterium]